MNILNMYIDNYNWKPNFKNKFFDSCNKILNINNCQFYYPVFNLFFNIKNNKQSRNIDIKRNIIINKINKIINKDQDNYNSNIIVNADCYNIKTKQKINKDIFVKQISILDISHIFLNNYNLFNKKKELQPSKYNYITTKKINDINNSCYIDCFFSLLVGDIQSKNILPCFPEYYGCINGMGNYYKDITEDIDEYEQFPGFDKGIGKLFDLNIYTSDKNKYLNQSTPKSDISDDSIYSDKSNSTIFSEDDQIVKFKNIPIMLLFMEKLDGTLEHFLNQENYNIDILLSCLFQISFGLSYLQNKFKFVHNDLHINNIMYKNTDIEFLYYKINDCYYKIPTYGKIFKIIDFGRSIYTFKNRLYMNDSFDHHGEAESQYNLKEEYIPNYSFDLCRLSTTIIDELTDFLDIEKLLYENTKEGNFIKLLFKIMSDKDNKLIYDGDEVSFQLYIDIAKKSVNGNPNDILSNNLFDFYKIDKLESKDKIYQLN